MKDGSVSQSSSATVKVSGFGGGAGFVPIDGIVKYLSIYLWNLKTK